jgi:hypothetical protein
MIKKVFLPIVLVFIGWAANAQVTTTKKAMPIKNRTKYDSLENYNSFALNKEKYIGQTLYLPSLKSDLLLSGLVIYYNVDDIESNQYKIAGKEKYFNIIDTVIVNAPYNNIFFKLTEKESGDTLYYRSDGNLPFTLVGYIVKLKKLNVGRNFTALRASSSLLDGVYDINTGAKVDYIVGSIWKCKDITIDEETHKPAMVLTNTKNQTILSLIDEYSYKYFLKK